MRNLGQIIFLFLLMSCNCKNEVKVEYDDTYGDYKKTALELLETHHQK